MNGLTRFWHWIPSAVRNKPFGIYVACVIWGVGLVGLIAGPPFEVAITPSQFFVTAVSVYFLTAATVVIVAMFSDEKKRPILSIFGEMYGWLFIAAAALATCVMYIESLFTYGMPSSVSEFVLWMGIWLGLFITASVRSVDILVSNRGQK